MAIRQYGITLTADTSGLVSGFSEASGAVTGMLDEVESKSAAINTLSAGFAVAGAALLGFSVLGVAKFAEFDSAMSSVRATTGEGIITMHKLRDAAMEAGARTAFSATEAAQGMDELAKAGVSTSDILSGALDGALDLAAAGGLEVGAAAETAASAMTQFGLAGSDVTHVADLLAAGAGKAQGEVSDFSQALNQSGLVAAQTGLTIEETTAGLASFASAGLVGSDAGTSFKTMLQRLTPQSKEAAETMESLGISAYDSGGQFVGLDKVAGQLQQAMSKLSPEARNAAMQVIFGADAVRAANVLYTQGAAGIQSWTDKVNDQGYAARIAADKMNNLSGDIEKLGGAFDTALISMGSGSDGALRGIVQGVTNVIDGFASLPPAVQGAFGVGSGLAGMSLLGIAALGKLVVGIVEVRTALQALNISAKTAGLALGGIGLVVGIAAAAFTIWSKNASEARERTDALKGSVDSVTGALKKSAAESFITTLREDINDTDWERLDAAGHGIDKAREALMKGPAAARAYADEMKNLAKEQRELYIKSDRTNKQADALRMAYEGLSSSMKRSADATEDAQKSAKINEQAMGKTADKANDVANAMTDLKSKYDAVNGSLQAQADAAKSAREEQEKLAGLALDSFSATTKYETALREAREGLAEITRGTDVHTEAGQKNRKTLEDLAGEIQDYAKSATEGGVAAEEIASRVGSGRDQFLAQAQAMGYTAEEATNLADKFGLIPPTVTSAVTVAMPDPGLQQRLLDLAQTVTAMNSTTADILVSADIDATKFEAKKDQAIGDIELLSTMVANPTGDLSAEQIHEKARAAMDQMTLLAIQKAVPTADLDPQALYNAVAASELQLDALSKMTPTPEIAADITRLKAGIDNGKAYLETVPPERWANLSVTGVDGVVRDATWARDSILGVNGKSVAIDVRDNASAAIGQVRSGLNSLSNKTVTLTTVQRRVIESVGGAAPGGIRGGIPWATGGFVTGPGTGTSDSIPARLSNGEFVVRAAAVSKYGADVLHQINAMRFAEGGQVVNGVPVRSPGKFQPQPAAAGTVVNQYITQNYPQSVPASLAIDKAMNLARVMV